MFNEGSLFSSWDLRVEPAFGRAIDFVVGQRRAEWVFGGGKASLQLTAAGRKAAEALTDEVFAEERDAIDKVARKATEAFVSKLLSMDRGLR